MASAQYEQSKARQSTIPANRKHILQDCIRPERPLQISLNLNERVLEFSTVIKKKIPVS